MKQLLIILIILSFGRWDIWAYEVNTHADISVAAAESSVLGVGQALADFGLDALITGQEFPNSKNDPRNILDLFRDGANFEDNLSLYRPINHFFDPLTGKGLSSSIFMMH